LIHRDVGLAQQVVEFGAVVRIDADADAARGHQAMARDAERLADAAQDPACDPLRPPTA
jgi:hypothetical protein